MKFIQSKNGCKTDSPKCEETHGHTYNIVGSCANSFSLCVWERERESIYSYFIQSQSAYKGPTYKVCEKDKDALNTTFIKTRTMNKVKLKMFYLQLQENKFSSQKLVIVILLYFILWSGEDKKLRLRERKEREKTFTQPEWTMKWGIFMFASLAWSCVLWL